MNEYAKPVTEITKAKIENLLVANSGPQSGDADAKKFSFDEDNDKGIDISLKSNSTNMWE